MAITDAYVYATRIAFALKKKKKKKRESKVGRSSNNNTEETTDDIPAAIASCDTVRRRNQAKKIILDARKFQDMFISSNPLVCWFLRLYIRFVPMSKFANQVDSFDQSNMEFLRFLDKEYAIEEQ